MQPSTTPPTTVATDITLGPDAVVRCDLHHGAPPILTIAVGPYELMITVDTEPSVDHVRIADRIVSQAIAFQVAVAAMVRRRSTADGPPNAAGWPSGRAVDG